MSMPNAPSPIPYLNLYPSIKINRLTIRYIYGVVDWELKKCIGGDFLYL